MENPKNNWTQGYDRPITRWVLSALLAIFCVVVTFLLYRVTFLNNDDANIMYALAGYRTGTPYPTHRFINVALGLLISALYGALPGLPWWTVYQLIAILLSLTVIYACIFKLAGRAGPPLWAAVGLAMLLYAGMFAYTVVWITFTLTAGLLGTAGCALIFSIDWERDCRGQRIASAIGAMALLILCFFTRNSTGYSLICFYAAAGLYQFLRSRRRARVAVCAFGVAGIAAAAMVVFLNNWGVARFNPAGYTEFEAARGRFIDYPHVTYSEDPAFFASLGWDETIYNLADNLCYLDPVVNAETMNAVTEYTHEQPAGIIARLTAALAAGEAFFRGSGVAQYMLVIPVVLVGWALFVGLRKLRQTAAECFIVCAVAAGAFLLCFYLCYAGRFPVRTFMLIAIPTAVIELLLLLKMWGETNELKENIKQDGGKHPNINRFFRYFGIFTSTLLLAWGVAKTQYTLLSYDKSETIRQNAAAEAYAIAHPDNLYLTDVTSLENINAFAVYRGNKPVNLVDWGGTGMHSGWKDMQLAANGIDEFTGALFDAEQVYFITVKDSDKLAMLDAYLKTHFGTSGYVAVETIIADITIYQFIWNEQEGGA